MSSETLILPIPPAEQAKPTVQPYKSLDYFNETDRDQRRFGGREREARELVARIPNQRTLVLYGRSGIGKTSLLLAGIFPELRREGFQPVYARTLISPLADLRRALLDGCALADTTADETLAELAARAVLAGPLVLVLDQFEEFFIRFRDHREEHAGFIQAIAGLINDRGLDLSVIFSLRQEFLAELDDFRQHLPDLFANEYRLRGLNAFGVRQAIARPLIDGGFSYEEAVISRLLDLLEPAGFDPPILQILCSELFKETAARAPSGEAPRITTEDLKRIGDLKSVFQRYLDGVIQVIPPDRHLLARILLDSLITQEKTKQAALIEDLVQKRDPVEDNAVEEVLEIMARHCLLRRQERDGRLWVELMHETLIPYVDEWLGRDPHFREFRQARAFIRNNSGSDIWIDDPRALLSLEILTDFLDPYRDLFRLSRREVEFVLRSSIYRRAPGVIFWARRYGRADALDIITTMLGSQRDADRIAALAAAGRMTEAKDRLLTWCLTLVLADPNPEVRREAATAITQLAPEEDLKAILRQNRLQHPYLEEALTNLCSAGHNLNGFSRWTRLRSHRRAQRRARREKADIIRARCRTGTQNGIVAGILWTLIALGVFAVLEPPGSANQEWKDALLWGPVALFWGAVLGGILGWLTSAATARRAAFPGEGEWARALLFSKGILSGGLMTGSLVFLANSEKFPGTRAVITGILLLAVLAQLELALSVRLVAPCIQPASSRAATWSWSFLGSLGLPILVPIVIFGILEIWTQAKGWTLMAQVALLFSAFLASFGSPVALIALVTSVRKWPLGPVPEISPAARRRHRILLAMTTAIAVALGALSYFEKANKSPHAALPLPAAADPLRLPLSPAPVR
jgi:hypothetical protein